MVLAISKSYLGARIWRSAIVVICMLVGWHLGLVTWHFETCTFEVSAVHIRMVSLRFLWYDVGSFSLSLGAFKSDTHTHIASIVRAAGSSDLGSPKMDPTLDFRCSSGIRSSWCSRCSSCMLAWPRGRDSFQQDHGMSPVCQPVVSRSLFVSFLDSRFVKGRCVCLLHLNCTIFLGTSWHIPFNFQRSLFSFSSFPFLPPFLFTSLLLSSSRVVLSWLLLSFSPFLCEEEVFATCDLRRLDAAGPQEHLKVSKKISCWTKQLLFSDVFWTNSNYFKLEDETKRHRK